MGIVHMTDSAISDLAIRVLAIRDALVLPGHYDIQDFAEPEAIRASEYAADAVAEAMLRIRTDADKLHDHVHRINVVLGAVDRYLSEAARSHGGH